METPSSIEEQDANVLSLTFPRVLVVDLSIRYGGASTRALAIAKYFMPGGSLLAGIANSPVIRSAEEMGIPVRVVASKRTDPRIPFRLAEIIRREGVEVVDTQNIQSKFWTSFAALFSNVRFVSTLNSLYSQEFGSSWKSRAYHKIDLFTNGRVDCFIAVSQTIQKALVNDGIPPHKIHLIRNAVELPAINTPENRAEILDRIGVPENTAICILVGRLVWAKGFDDFINAFLLISNKRNDVRAVIIGDGELRKEIEDQIQKLSLSEKIILLGHQDRPVVQQILRIADIFVMPSRSEGVPYALLEAAAMGKPIVATNCGGIPEVVENAKSALLVPIGDIQSLADAIASLLGDRSLARSLGQAARKRIEQDYSLNAQMELTKNAYINNADRKLSEKP